MISVEGLSNKLLAEVILSSAISLEYATGAKTRNRGEHQVFPKRIIFDFKPEHSYFVVNNKTIININNGDKILGTDSIVEEIKKSLVDGDATDDLSANYAFEFIKMDEVTRSVLIFSKDYISQYENADGNYLGKMVLDYFDVWYMGKVGKGKYQAKAHHEIFRSFSIKETEYFNHSYIPIAVTPKDLNPISKAIEVAINRSPLHEFVETTVGYNISGSRVDGSKTFWIPTIVAKEYLEESDDLKVFSRRVLEKLMVNAGFCGVPAVQNEKQISNAVLTKADITKTADEFILRKRYPENSDSAVALAVRPKALISMDIKEEDNFIPDDAGEINLDY